MFSLYSFLLRLRQYLLFLGCVREVALFRVHPPLFPGEAFETDYTAFIVHVCLFLNVLVDFTFQSFKPALHPF